jgi:hypothetical protein
MPFDPKQQMEDVGYVFCCTREQESACLALGLSRVIGHESFFTFPHVKNENHWPWALYNMIKHVSRSPELGDVVKVHFDFRSSAVVLTAKFLQKIDDNRCEVSIEDNCVIVNVKDVVFPTHLRW